jgi:hypothetical protein
MISLETAQRLKDAGLKWEPKEGDYFAHVDGQRQEEVWHPNIFVVSGEHILVEELGGRMVFFGGGLCVRGAGCRMNDTHCYCMNRTGFNPDLKTFSVASWEKDLWLPRLDQLLAEIEGQGWKWGLLFEGQIDVTSGNQHKSFYAADSPEEAAAQALLWIYEQRRQANED